MCQRAFHSPGKPKEVRTPGSPHRSPARTFSPGRYKQYYGKGSLYPRIFEANREVIKNADLIYPGQKIRIPLD
jgi:hypothetical protein